jgi:hypothetical protein
LQPQAATKRPRARSTGVSSSEVSGRRTSTDAVRSSSSRSSVLTRGVVEGRVPARTDIVRRMDAEDGPDRLSQKTTSCAQQLPSCKRLAQGEDVQWYLVIDGFCDMENAHAGSHVADQLNQRGAVHTAQAGIRDQQVNVGKLDGQFEG